MGNRGPIHCFPQSLADFCSVVSVTGTFGGVDFLHSVLGEATDHFAQSEVDELDIALKSAQDGAARGGDGSRGLLGSSTRDFVGLVGQLPGMGGGFAAEARDLQARSAAQEEQNRAEGGTVIPGTNFDAVETVRKIYPILYALAVRAFASLWGMGPAPEQVFANSHFSRAFRDRVVKAINTAIAKVPGLEKLLEHISETLTAFVLGLLAPFIRPIINQVSKVCLVPLAKAS